MGHSEMVAALSTGRVRRTACSCPIAPLSCAPKRSAPRAAAQRAASGCQHRNAPSATLRHNAAQRLRRNNEYFCGLGLVSPDWRPVRLQEGTERY